MNKTYPKSFHRAMMKQTNITHKINILENEERLLRIIWNSLSS